jgi:thioester reductase-like protein
MTSTERFLQNRVAEIAGVAVSRVSVVTALSRLGVDSLGMLHLIESIEGELGAEVPHNVCLDGLTIQALAETLAAAPRQALRPTVDVAQQIAADSELPEDIRPPCGETVAAVPRSILLTGATGFLGAFLLRSLLRNTRAQIVCLVRPDGESVHARLTRSLERYGIHADDFGSRISALPGDIAQPRLGLSPHSFDALSSDVDVIFHAAAAVNWVQPYTRLRHANVLAVRELLRLACSKRPKPFHLISSLAACYSTSGFLEISESDDVSADVGGLHLAYAQSKCAAESLARAAASRGLPVSIFRSALISGDSVSGISNSADLVSSLIKGCIQIGAAPDLDWRLDLMPVDFVAEAMTQLVCEDRTEQLQVFHLANPKGRHWREFVLWMNLYGYRIELLQYEEWLDELRVAVFSQNQHPLRDLLPFFIRRPAENSRLYLPQLYEESRRRRVRFDVTRQRLKGADLMCPGLSAGLLDRYFKSFVDLGFLPLVQKPDATDASPDHALRFDARFFKSVIGSDVVGADAQEWSGSHSVIAELTSWKYGRSIGLHSFRLEFGEARDAVDVVLKVKARDREVNAVGQTVAELCSPALGNAYERFSDCLGLSGSDTRELAIYRQGDARFCRFTPRFYGGCSDHARTVLVLENLSGLEMMDSIDSVPVWHSKYIETAIEGIAELHAIHYPHAKRLTRRRDLDAGDLWIALADHARPMFASWIGPEIQAVQRRLIERLSEFQQVRESMPQTLIHNDFNPRNLGFRHFGRELSLCLYDWELATSDLPQHDLAELLCFVIGTDFQQADLLRYIEMHRMSLQRAAGVNINKTSWEVGFCVSLYDLMINRLPAYAMIHRFSEQRFLERVVRTWKGIFDVMSSAIHTHL